MPVSTLAVTSVLGVLALCQYLYTYPDRVAKEEAQAKKQARYDAKREEILRNIQEKQETREIERALRNEYKPTPYPTPYPINTTQPGFAVEVVTPAPSKPVTPALEVGNGLHDATDTQSEESEVDNEVEN